MRKAEKIMFIFGTRPEAIKLVPVIKKMKDRTDVFEPLVVVTGQHREMLDEVLKLFHVQANHDLGIMEENQSLEDVTIRCLEGLSEAVQIERPRMIIVQGDTTTTFVGALAGYYNKVMVGHIEAGLRSHDKFQPFPEEINRKLTTVLADLHFAPTKLAADNLRNNGVASNEIFVTGNTVIDTLLGVVGRKYTFTGRLNEIISRGGRLILVTAHRRESFGRPLEDICVALKEIAERVKDVQILFPVHPNPNVVGTVNSYIKNDKRIHLLSPLDYETFAHVMRESYLVLSDSGGIQEEAPSLGKPVLVLRNKTERQEALVAGTARLVGTDANRIISESLNLLENEAEYKRMARAVNPYGDGKASERILDTISDKLIARRNGEKERE